MILEIVEGNELQDMLIPFIVSRHLLTLLR